MHRRLILLSLVIALIAAACGGGGEAVDDTIAATEPTTTTIAPTTTAAEAPGDTQAPTVEETTTTVAATPVAAGATLRSTVFKDDPVVPTSGRFEAIIEFGLPGDSGDIEMILMEMSGAFDTATASSTMSIDMGSAIVAMAEAEGEEIPPAFVAMFAEPMQVITIGDKAWIKSGFFTMFLGAEGWVETDVENSDDVSGSVGFDTFGTPDQMLEQLADANAEVTEIGTEEVRGVATIHYRAIVDAAAYAETLSPEERREFESGLGSGEIPDLIPMDLWVGEGDGRLYRYKLVLEDLGSDEGPNEATVTFDMFDYDQPVEILPPPEDEILSEDELGGFFEGMFGSFGDTEG